MWEKARNRAPDPDEPPPQVAVLVPPAVPAEGFVEQSGAGKEVAAVDDPEREAARLGFDGVEVGGRGLVDAGGNALLRVAGNRDVTTLTSFPSRDDGCKTDSVPN